MGWPISSPLAAIALGCALMAGCATAPKPQGNFAVKVSSSGPVEITGATAHVFPYGLVVQGQIHIGRNIEVAAVHSVDVVITGPDGKEIRKFTSQYFPTPRIHRKKPQQAHFTVVTYSVPPAGSAISVTLTPEPKIEHPGAPEEPGEPAPENR